MNPEQTRTGSGTSWPESAQRFLWLVLWASPGIGLGCLIYVFGVDVPYKDQWDAICPLLQAGDAGTLQLRDFWAWHMEHRFFPPRIVIYGLAKLTHWNVRAELFVVWLLAWACALNTWRVARTTGWPAMVDLKLLTLANVLIFTPLAVENWLMGIQIVYLLPLACLTATLWVVPTLRFPGNFLTAMVLCVVCTFSVASGFISWLLAGALLFFSPDGVRGRGRRLALTFWVSACLVSVILYFRGYSKPFQSYPDFVNVFQHPLPGLHYFLAYLGGPFACKSAFVSVLPIATTMGTILLLLVLAAAACVWRWRHNARLVAETLPWLMFSLITILHAAITAVGRYHMGAEQALSSRYFAFSVQLPIGLLFLGSVLFRHWRVTVSQESQPTVRRILLSTVAAFCLLHMLTVRPFLGKWREFQHTLLSTKALVMLINTVDAPNELRLLVHPEEDVSILKERVNFLNRIGYLRPGLIRSQSIRSIVGATAWQSPTFGRIDNVRWTTNQQIMITGWAILPQKSRPADVILFTYTGMHGEQVIFSLVVGLIPRFDIVHALRQPGYIDSGWSKVLDRTLLPPNARTIDAWAFDAENGRAYPIEGNVTLAQ